MLERIIIHIHPGNELSSGTFWKLFASCLGRNIYAHYLETIIPSFVSVSSSLSSHLLETVLGGACSSFQRK